MTAILTVPVFGTSQQKNQQADSLETFRFPVAVRRAMLEQNTFNAADELHVSLSWKDVGVDPRFLKNATIEFWLGNAEENGVFVPSDKNFRFIGMNTQTSRVIQSGSDFSVEMRFLDYTTLFIGCKPFPSDGVPHYSDTLTDAWNRICDFTGYYSSGLGRIQSTVSVLKDRLEFRGDATNVKIGKAVPARLAKLSKVQTHPGEEAWAVWQRCVGSVGLISYIELDKCIVTTATDFYTVKNPPVMVYGRNILNGSEHSDVAFSDRGIGLTSFDPTTGSVVEAFYPIAGDARLRSKSVSAHKVAANAIALQSEKYDFYSYPESVTQEALEFAARRIYEERSRQEFEGNITTSEMFVGTDSSPSPTFDLLSLKAGDAIKVNFDKDLLQTLQQLPTESERVAKAVDLGYSPAVARLLSRNVESIAALDSTFHTKVVRTELEFTPEGGSFSVDIGFHNRIKITGDAER